MKYFEILLELKFGIPISTPKNYNLDTIGFPNYLLKLINKFKEYKSILIICDNYLNFLLPIIFENYFEKIYFYSDNKDIIEHSYVNKIINNLKFQIIDKINVNVDLVYGDIDINLLKDINYPDVYSKNNYPNYRNCNFLNIYLSKNKGKYNELFYYLNDYDIYLEKSQKLIQEKNILNEIIIIDIIEIFYKLNYKNKLKIFLYNYIIHNENFSKIEKYLKDIFCIPKLIISEYLINLKIDNSFYPKINDKKIEIFSKFNKKLISIPFENKIYFISNICEVNNNYIFFVKTQNYIFKKIEINKNFTFYKIKEDYIFKFSNIYLTSENNILNLYTKNNLFYTKYII